MIRSICVTDAIDFKQTAIPDTLKWLKLEDKFYKQTGPDFPQKPDQTSAHMTHGNHRQIIRQAPYYYFSKRFICNKLKKLIKLITEHI